VPFEPACVDITGVRAGDRNEMTFSITSGGTPVDLTGQTLAAQARRKATDTDVAVTAIVTITDPLAGTGTLRWPGSQVMTSLAGTASWTGVWDLQMGNGVDDPTTLVGGKFTTTIDVTRP
jgi:2-phospho-L-lactate transferase/gluconeogenesis factor (CofD/UPF0052 family)